MDIYINLDQYGPPHTSSCSGVNINNNTHSIACAICILNIEPGDK